MSYSVPHPKDTALNKTDMVSDHEAYYLMGKTHIHTAIHKIDN